MNEHVKHDAWGAGVEWKNNGPDYVGVKLSKSMNAHIIPAGPNDPEFAKCCV